MKKLSLDPRVNRMEFSGEPEDMAPIEKGEMWPTYEVFRQDKRGKQHTHVGIVHAPNPEMAMVFAKEQYARRGNISNLWVVKSKEIYASDYDDEDIFDTVPEKLHREPSPYKVKEKLKKLQQKEKSSKDE